jgi:hypothetical protein
MGTVRAQPFAPVTHSRRRVSAPHTAPDLFEDHIARDLEKEITQEENAGTPAEDVGVMVSAAKLTFVRSMYATK